MFFLDTYAVYCYNIGRNAYRIKMGKKTEFLYLSEEDVIEAGALDYSRCIDVW